MINEINICSTVRAWYFCQRVAYLESCNPFIFTMFYFCAHVYIIPSNLLHSTPLSLSVSLSPEPSPAAWQQEVLWTKAGSNEEVRSHSSGCNNHHPACQQAFLHSSHTQSLTEKTHTQNHAFTEGIKQYPLWKGLSLSSISTCPDLIVNLNS